MTPPPPADVSQRTGACCAVRVFPYGVPPCGVLGAGPGCPDANARAEDAFQKALAEMKKAPPERG